MNSQRSRKSIKMLKQSSKNITNKWKKDEEDHEIVELLAESIRSPTKPKQEDISTLKPPPVRTEIGAKLVETSVKQEDSFNFELPDTSREQARQPQIANSSHVEIFVAENSEDNSKI